MLTPVPGRGAAKEQIVIAVPAELKNVVEPIEALIRAVEEARKSARGGGAVDYAAVERTVEERAAAIERAAHADILPALEVDAPRVTIRGKTYTRIAEASPGTYFTMTGPVVVLRALYREDGVRNGPAVDAISLRAGVYQRGWLPKTAEAIGHHMQQGTCREAAASSKQNGRLPYSPGTFDRVVHGLGEQWLEHHADIEDALIEGFKMPEAAYSISVALDRVSIPMAEPAKRPVGRPRKDAPKQPVTRVFRMAYCAALTIHDRDGDALHTIRRACMPQSDPELLCLAMANDVYRLRESKPDLKLKLLADGSPEMWGLLERASPPDVFGDVERGVDFWHLIEKLAPAAKVLFGDDAAPAELRRWKKRLRGTDKAVAEIRDELDRSGLEWTWRDSKQPVHEAITYMENHAERMCYASALRNGMPIGSGNVEATCKTVAGVRMKRAGSRWNHKTGEHVLQLRALAVSDRWEPAMAKLHAER